MRRFYSLAVAGPIARGLVDLAGGWTILLVGTGCAVALPSGTTEVYTGSVYLKNLTRQRVVHLNQHSGQPLLDVPHGDYGPLGRMLEWSINVHRGQQWGLANQLFLFAACAATVLLC